MFRRLTSNFCRSYQSFKSDQSGAITAFALVAFLAMFVAVGMGMDFMRQEAHRAELQDALDRGILAAATFTNEDTVEVTVRDYLKSSNLMDSDLNLLVTSQKTAASTRVNATASYDIGTFFLKIVGINDLGVSASGSAMQGVSNVEISLALDISGSMARERTAMTDTTVNAMQNYGFPTSLTWGNNRNNVSRLDFLRVAASSFVDDILDEANAQTSSISLIPFAGNVNPGPATFDILNDDSRQHLYSSCIDFTDSDFSSTSLPPVDSREHTEHFQWFKFEADSGHDAQWGWCPSDNQAIEYMSNDAPLLKQRISEFTAHDGTGTHIGMKWALALLDDSANHVYNELDDTGGIPSEFSNRPSEYDDDDVLKVIVIMTDGNTTDQIRVKDDFYPRTQGRYPSDSDDADSSDSDEDDPNVPWVEYWASNSLGSNDSYRAGSNASRMESDQATNRANFLEQCTLAKDNGVVVFTIGFDLDAASLAHSDLFACASSENHFHSANGSGLKDAFDSIATTITKLRLIN